MTHEAAAHIMGTAVTITLGDRTPRSDTTATAVSRAMDHLRGMEALFSTFLPNSEISEIRDGCLPVARAHPYVRRVLEDCQRLKEATRGAFNHEANGLDPAGYVKGWAVEGAARRLERAGINDFMIWAGGDVLARIPGAASGGWRVGIRHPHDPAMCFESVEIRNGAVATSGFYERGNHIVCQSRNDLTSASVVGPNLGVADALATAAMSSGLQQIDWLAHFPSYQLMALTADNTVHRTRPQTVEMTRPQRTARTPA